MTTHVVREGYWLCPYCSGRNRGPVRDCTGCGAPRGDDVPFRYDESAAEVTDAARLSEARLGADWVCPSCDTANRGDSASCANCGGARADGKALPTGFRPEPAPAAPLPVTAPPAGRRRLRNVLLAAALVGGGGFFAMRGRETTLEVTGRSWERTVEIEAIRTVRESGWEGELPAGARPVSRTRAIHHHDTVVVGSRSVTREVEERVQAGTRRVKTGTRDLGNGYFEDVYEDEPVYETRTKRVTEEEPVTEQRPVWRTKVTFDIDRWTPLRTERAAGDGATNPAGPDPRLAPGEREGKRSEACRLVLADRKGKSWTKEVPCADFPAWTPGRRATARVGPLGGPGELAAE